MFGSPSQIDALLTQLQDDAKENPEVRLFLEEGDVLSELHNENNALVEYMASGANMKILMNYALLRTTMPEDTELQRRYAGMSMEILSCKIEPISGNLVANKPLMEQLARVLEDARAGQLRLDLSLTVCRILVSLLRVHNIEVLTFIGERDYFMDSIFRHLNLNPVSEFLVRFLDGPESDNDILPPRKDATQLLANSRVFDRLADTFVDCTKSETMDRQLREETLLNVADCITSIALKVLELAKMFVHIPTSLNPFQNTKALSSMLLAGLHDFNLSRDALSVATELLTTKANEIEVNTEPRGKQGGKALTSVVNMAQKRNIGRPRERPPLHINVNKNKEPVKTKPVVSTETLENELQGCFQPLVDALEKGAPRKGVENSAGFIQEPLGWTRLKIVEFLIACLKRGNDNTISAIDDVEAPRVLLELFFKYEWNSMLHHMVTSAIIHALESDEEIAQAAWLGEDLIKRLIAKWKEETAQREDEGVSNQFRSAGHLGHIIVLANALSTFFEKKSDRKRMFASDEELAAFDRFVTESIAEAKQRQEVVLGGSRPTGSDSGSDVVEEATNVFDVDSILKDVPAWKRHSSKDDSDEDDDEVEVVDTTLTADEMSQVIKARRASPQRSANDDWVAFDNRGAANDCKDTNSNDSKAESQASEMING